MLNDIMYTEAEIQSIAPHLIEQILGNFPKITNAVFPNVMSFETHLLINQTKEKYLCNKI